MQHTAPGQIFSLDNQQPRWGCKNVAEHWRDNKKLTGGFRVYTETDPGRASAETYIHRQFSSYFGANVKQFMPYILTLEKQGEISAAIGFRLAASHTLFLEQYLIKPVEQMVSETINTPAKRASIVEIGNLAASRSGQTKQLFMLLALLLENMGYAWVVCNTTPLIRNTFKRMGFEYLTLQRTSSRSLQEDASLWGSYYSHDPRLCLGSLSYAAQKILTLNHPSIGFTLQQAQLLAAQINHKRVAA